MSRGRGKARKTLDLVEAAIRIMLEIQPASVRAVCYRLFVEGSIASMSKANTDAVSRHLVWAREQGMLPWEWIVDETREAERPGTWNNPDQIIAAAVGQYRRNYWQDQEDWVEVWSEKGTVRGTLAPILKQYGCTFRVMHGYGSATSLHGISEETRNSDKSLTVLYAGDWDPSGMHMSAIDLPARLERYNGDVHLIRIALDEEDVGPRTALPSFDLESKSGDPRCTWFRNRYGNRCWELDAMSPVELRRRTEHWIRSHLDLTAWEHSVAVEKAEMDSMQSFFSNWKSISGQAPKYSGGAE